MTETPRLSRKQLRELGQLTTRSDDTPGLTDTAELRLRRPSRKEMREAERAEREQNLELERIAQEEAAQQAVEADLSADSIADVDLAATAENDAVELQSGQEVISETAEFTAEEEVADNAIDFFGLGNTESEVVEEVEAPVVTAPERKSIFDRFSTEETATEDLANVEAVDAENLAAEITEESAELAGTETDLEDEPTGFEDFLNEAEEEIQAKEAAASVEAAETEAESEAEAASLRERLFSKMRRNHSFEKVLGTAAETEAEESEVLAETEAEEVAPVDTEDALEEVREIDLEEVAAPQDIAAEVEAEEAKAETVDTEDAEDEVEELKNAVAAEVAEEAEEAEEAPVVAEDSAATLETAEAELQETEAGENLEVEESSAVVHDSEVETEVETEAVDTIDVPETTGAGIEPLGVAEEIEKADEVAVSAETVSVRSWIVFALLVLVVAVLGYLGGSWIHNTFFAASTAGNIIENVQSFLL